MHELGVLTEAVRTVERIAAENKVNRVRYISLEIGELTGYLPVFFEKYFPVVVENKPLFEGAELRMRTVRGQALCRDCEALYNVLRCEGRCPKCGSREKTILGGQEFLIKEIAY
ncbi:MAG: hydrogenase maturation nickel metallochaperone HypA [Oscillospiraceae bacterium]|nr:hydrogenase maturation nickel metallochaperone HypA [Oscillospiraceae bacterium]